MGIAIVKKILPVLLERLPDDMFVRLMERTIGWCENKIVQSKNTFDDAFLLPLFSQIRKELNLPAREIEINSDKELDIE